VQVQPEPMMPHQARRTREEEAEAAEARSYKRHTPSKHPPKEVTRPDHYERSNGVDKESATRAMLEGETDPYRAHLRANGVKYLWRMGHKDSPLRDAQKARQYIQWLVEHEQAKETTKAG